LINILHILDTTYLSGPGKTVLNSYKYIKPDKYSILIAVLSNGHNKYVEYLKSQKIPVVEVKERYFSLHYSLCYFFIIFAIRKIIKKNKIDIVHTHSYKPDVLGFLSQFGTNSKCISTLHGFIQNTKRSVFANYLSKWISKRNPATIVVSEKMKTDLVNLGIPAKKLKLVHNAIVADHYKNLNQKTELIEQHKLEKESIILGCIGRISPEKGQRFLCQSFLGVIRNYPNTQLIFIGHGPDYESLTDEYKQYENNIKFLGYKQNIRDYISILDIHVLPSFTEGLPNVILETSIMEVANIATNVGGNSECIRNFETGIIVEVGDESEMTNAIVKMIENENLRKQYAINGRNYILENFAFEKRMLKIEKIYDEIINL